MDKNKKKTLTISSNLKKKIDTTTISTAGKKSFSVEKKNHLDKTNLLIGPHHPRTQTQVKSPKKRILLENLLNNKQLKIS